MSKREESGDRSLTPREMNRAVKEMTRYLPRILKIKPHYVGVCDEKDIRSDYKN